MANHNDTSQVEEGDKSARPSSVPMLPSTIEPLPYFPNLHRCIHGVTASLVLTYLEIHRAFFGRRLILVKRSGCLSRTSLISPRYSSSLSSSPSSPVMSFLDVSLAKRSCDLIS